MKRKRNEKHNFKRLQKAGLDVVVEDNHTKIKADDVKLLQQYAEILNYFN